MVTTIADVRVGHHTDPVAATGCTVIVLPPGTVASGEVRGGAPATREFALLDPAATVDTVDAVVLTGGSAFGLACADGVVAALEAAGRGFPTPAGRVPIVVAMGLYDLLVGDASVRPGPAEGQAATLAALGPSGSAPPGDGAVGAGTGATVGKWRGAAAVRPGGLGTATASAGGVTVAATIAVNAGGDFDDGVTVAAIREGSFVVPADDPDMAMGNTTIGCIVTDAKLDAADCHAVARSGHDGLARALIPVHTALDGDALVAAATGRVDAPVSLVRLLAVVAVADAVAAAVAR